MLGVTEEQYEQARTWYLSAQQDCAANKNNTTNIADKSFKQ